MRTLLLLPLLLVACAQPSPEAPPDDISPASRAPLPDSETPYFILGPLGRSATAPRRDPATLDSTTRARRRDSMMAEMASRMDEVLDAQASLSGAETWQEADAIARRRLGPDSLVSHRVAVAMLDHHLLRGDLDDAKADALGRYTQALLDHRSEEGALVLWALKRLGRRWTSERRRRAAEVSADRLGAAYTRLAGCIDCTLDEALQAMRPVPRRAAEGRLHDMVAVYRELRRLADDGTP